MTGPGNGRPVPGAALTDEQRGLAESHVGAALKIARKYARRCPAEQESFEAAALMGLCFAARSFDASRGVPFAPFAARRIVGEIIDASHELMPKGFRRASYRAARGEEVPVIRSLDAAAENGDTLGRMLESAELPVRWELESLDEVESVARRLPRQHATAVRLFFAQCETATMKRVADHMGLSESRVSQVLGTAAGLLKGTCA